MAVVNADLKGEIRIRADGFWLEASHTEGPLPTDLPVMIIEDVEMPIFVR